jgi:hypothetical protein
MNHGANHGRGWRAVLACAALFVYLAVAVMPFGRLVLCVRPGHVGLEVAAGAAGCLDCAPSEAEGDGDDGCCTRTEEGGGDAPCRDIVLLQHEEEPGVRPTPLQLPSLPALASVTEFAVALARCEVRPLVERSASDPPRPPPFRLARVLRV